MRRIAGLRAAYFAPWNMPQRELLAIDRDRLRQARGAGCILLPWRLFVLFYFAYKYFTPAYGGNDFFHYYNVYLHPWNFP